MDSAHHLDILDYYARYYRDGMTDLSSSSPPSGGEPEDCPVDYAAPGGLPALREMIAGLYLNVRASDVIVTNGASEALAATAFALVRPGDRVVAGPAVYPSFREVAARLGANLIAQDSGAASLIALNNPSVPDGLLADLRAVLAAAEARDARVVADEVHLDLRRQSPGVPAAAISETAVSIGDLSKPLGLGGLRIGWAVCRDPQATQAIGAAVQLLSGGPSALAMDYAAQAIAEYEPRLSRRCAAAEVSAPAVFEVLAEAGWRFERPQAGWTFLATPRDPLSEDQLARMRQSGCFLVPATVFGMAQGYRLSVFAPVEPLRRALNLPAREISTAGAGIVVLTKAPQPGFSKTRLGAALGHEVAAELAGAFLDDTLATAQATGCDVALAYAPPEERDAIADRAPGLQMVPQPDGDLGIRIRAALDAVVAGRPAAVLIGSDTPHLPASTLHDAIGALKGADLVVGPASDGGFYLLGTSLRELPAQLFAGIEWSSASVFERLMDNAVLLNLRVHTLGLLTDIDDAGSFREVVASLGYASSAPRTMAVAARLGLEARDVS